MKSVNELDKLEIRNVVGGMLSPTDREAFITINYQRAAIDIELLLTIFDTKQCKRLSNRTLFMRRHQ